MSRWRATATVAAVLAGAATGGCGSADQAITRGGVVAGATLSIYSLLPEPGRGSSRDIVDGQKLALHDAGGEAGGYAINFVSLDEGAAGGRDGAREAAVVLRDAVADPQVIALIGPGGSDAGRVTVPLFNAAGVLEVTPGAGYAGYTEQVRAGEPERWQPSGRRTLARLVGDDRVQAAALLRAAGGSRARVLVEQEPGPVADALVAALRAEGARLVEEPARAEAVIYAGEDPENAAAVANDLVTEAPEATIVLPDAVTRADVAERLHGPARRRAVLVSSAPEPGSTPALREFAARFRELYDRAPGPYAAVGHEAMRSVLAAIDRVGEDARSRQAVIDAYFEPDVRDPTLLGAYRILADGRREPAPFVAAGARR